MTQTANILFNRILLFFQFGFNCMVMRLPQIKAKEGEQFEENLKQQFDDIVESNEVVERAKERASEIINRAEAYAIEIREGSLEYAEDVISSVEHNLIEILEIVKRNKRELREE